MSFFFSCFVSLGSRRGGPLQSVRESNTGWCCPQALDRTTREHPHLLGSEAMSKRDCPATAAQVQTLQMTALPLGASKHL